jgi:putative salt-induced outer membrane protein YdiY
MKAWILAGMVAGVATVSSAQVVAPAAVPDPLWKTTVAAGANVTRGNSETLLLNGSVVSVFKQEKNEARVGVEANYGETEVTEGTGTNATKRTDTNVNNARAFGEYRRLLTERNYAYGNAELMMDDVADIDYRLMVGPGVGRYFLMSDAQKLSGEAGVAYIQEKLAGIEDDRVALRLAERYDLKVSATASVWESVEYLPSFEDFGQYLLNAECGAEAAMNASLSLRVVLQDKYNSEPAPGKDQNDLRLIAGLSYKL